MQLISFVLGVTLVVSVALWYLKHGDNDAL